MAEGVRHLNYFYNTRGTRTTINGSVPEYTVPVSTFPFQTQRKSSTAVECHILTRHPWYTSYHEFDNNSKASVASKHAQFVH